MFKKPKKTNKNNVEKGKTKLKYQLYDAKNKLSLLIIGATEKNTIPKFINNIQIDLKRNNYNWALNLGETITTTENNNSKTIIIINQQKNSETNIAKVGGLIRRRFNMSLEQEYKLKEDNSIASNLSKEHKSLISYKPEVMYQLYEAKNKLSLLIAPDIGEIYDLKNGIKNHLEKNKLGWKLTSNTFTSLQDEKKTDLNIFIINQQDNSKTNISKIKKYVKLALEVYLEKNYKLKEDNSMANNLGFENKKVIGYKKDDNSSDDNKSSKYCDSNVEKSKVSSENNNQFKPY